jgi:tripartite-type tricarboxylate transporter receptor subunit TctC
VQDFSGITPLGNLPLVLVISPDKNIKTLKELVTAAKAKPGSLNYAAAGIGTPPHLTMERFRLAGGFTGQVVPFRGAPEGLTEVMAGRVDVYFAPITPALPLIRDGKLLALAVSKPSAALPLCRTCPPRSRLVIRIPTSISGRTFVPKQTPRDIVNRLHQRRSRGLETPSVSEKLVGFGVEP